jgi:hypothetical protein
MWQQTSSTGQPATVHRQHRTRDVPRAMTTQEHHQRRNVVGSDEPAAGLLAKQKVALGFLWGSGKILVDQAAKGSPADPKRLSSMAARTVAMRWAPCGDHLMRCFFAIRALAISSTQPSALDVEIGSLERYRVP